MKILYVEDHERFAQQVIQHFLDGHEVVLVGSLDSARGALSKEQYDILLVDYDLDDGKGSTLVLELRTRGERTPIVATSARPEGNAALLLAGADAICGKLDFAGVGQVLAALGSQQSWPTRKTPRS